MGRREVQFSFGIGQFRVPLYSDANLLYPGGANVYDSGAVARASRQRDNESQQEQEHYIVLT